MDKYLELLVKLSTVAPEVFDEILVILNAVRRVFELLQGPQPLRAAAEIPPDVATAENAVIARQHGEGVGGPLMELLAFLRNNPELVALLLSLFAKK